MEEKYLLELGDVCYSNYEQIKSIAQSDKINETTKAAFLKSAFEKVSTDNKYKMLFDDCLIDIEKETTDIQIELLQKLLLGLGNIFPEYQSRKIDKAGKLTFGTYKGKGLTEVLTTEPSYIQWCLKNVNGFNIKVSTRKYDIIKSIAKSKKIAKVAKVTFLKSAFEKANVEYQYKLLFEDCLIDIKEETAESQIELLRKIGKLNINQIKSIAQSDKIEESAKVAFLPSSFEKVNDTFLKSVFEETRVKYQCKKIVDDLIFSSDEQIDFLQKYLKDYQWLSCLKLYSQELYYKLFEKNYSQISKKDRLILWLQRLNPYYNYLELVQAAWQLSNDERKLFNRRLKEHAKEERWQNFLDQVPTAKLIEETENTKTYNCKWRNLHYSNGAIRVFLDKTTATEDYTWNPSREEWNLLTQEYFNNRRIDDIIVTVDNYNRITEITGLEDIEINIILAEMRKNAATKRKIDISSSQLTKIIHNVVARNQCMNFLISQNSDYKLLYIQELITDNYGSWRSDTSFLIPIPDGIGNVYLIWESAEFEKSKATHIFKCQEEVINEMEEKIKDFIECNYKTRSRLNSVEHDDIEAKKDLQYLCRVNHDMVDYQVWENRMREVLPFLK